MKNMKELKAYLKTTKFGLKDYNKTFQKYKDYKNLEWNALMSRNKEEIEDYLNNLSDLIINEMMSSTAWNYRLQNSDYTDKSKIRELKTFINNTTYAMNIKFMKQLTNGNDNQSKSFATKLYLVYYNKINSEMKKSLIEILMNSVKLNFDKKNAEKDSIPDAGGEQ